MAEAPRRPLEPLADTVRARSLADTLAAAPSPGAIRVFAYGSLIWNPCFEYASREPALLRDYRRSFSVWSVSARGTPEAPGLGFGLERRAGVTCRGIVFALPPGAGASELTALWEREMWADTYRPEWVSLPDGGEPGYALTFVISPDHPMYAGDLDTAEKARYIAAASGKFGTCRAYLTETYAALREHGFDDPEMAALIAEVLKNDG